MKKGQKGKVTTERHPEINGKNRTILCRCNSSEFPELPFNDYDFFNLGKWNKTCPKCEIWYFYKIKE